MTKTDYMRGMQCPKMLWLDKHRPELKVIPPESQQRMDAGNDFGDRAMAMFGEYEEMTVYQPGTKYPDTYAMASNTREHLMIGTPVICEAAFFNNRNYCAVDILRKTDDGYDMYEVKNSSEVKDQFIRDAGFQYYIANNEVNIGHIYIVTHGDDEANPFVINDVTEQVKAYAGCVENNIRELYRVQIEQEEVQAEVGNQCREPYECWYYAYCHGGHCGIT